MNNVTRTASVFFIKTIYSVLVSVICLLANIPFPFIPIQITVLDAAIEGYPSFLTIWESDTRKIRGQILKDGVIQCAAVCPHSHGDGRSHQYHCSVYGGAAADSHVFSADLYFHGSRGEELYSV